MLGEIDDNEDISRKKGPQSVPQAPCMSNCPPQSWKKTSEAQPMEIDLSAILLVTEHSRDEPTLFGP
jgi:hypothetical protein